MIWHTTNYFNQDFVTETGVSEKKYPDRTTYQPFAVILGITHTLGESDTKEDAQAWLDKWVSEGEKEGKQERTGKQ